MCTYRKKSWSMWDWVLRTISVGFRGYLHGLLKLPNLTVPLILVHTKMWMHVPKVTQHVRRQGFKPTSAGSKVLASVLWLPSWEQDLPKAWLSRAEAAPWGTCPSFPIQKWSLSQAWFHKLSPRPGTLLAAFLISRRVTEPWLHLGVPRPWAGRLLERFWCWIYLLFSFPSHPLIENDSMQLSAWRPRVSAPQPVPIAQIPIVMTSST